MIFNAMVLSFFLLCYLCLWKAFLEVERLTGTRKIASSSPAAQTVGCELVSGAWLVAYCIYHLCYSALEPCIETYRGDPAL